MKKFVFACVHNAGRSQMAAAWFNELADPALGQGVSAGTQPGERVHPEVVEAMLEVERVLRSVGTLLNRGLRASQDTAMRDEIGRYRENLLRLHRELSAMENSAIRSRARLFTREEHLQAAQAWCAAARSTR